RHSVDSGNSWIGHSCEHVMQAVAELVEQRGDLVVRQQGGRCADRRRKVAYQLRDGQSLARRQGFGNDAFVHPRAAALLGTRVRIEIEARDDVPSSIFEIVVRYARMPYAHPRALPDRDAVETLC